MKRLALLLLLAACDSSTRLPTETIIITRANAEPIRMVVEIADDDAERATGLMNRSYLPEDKGMLFVFDQPAVQNFWMRNTLIPLDMIFINAEGKIAHIHRAARPHDETPISSRFPVQQVLEVNAGLVTRWGLREGDIILLDKKQGIN